MKNEIVAFREVAADGTPITDWIDGSLPANTLPLHPGATIQFAYAQPVPFRPTAEVQLAAERYSRLRILGCAPCDTKHLQEGHVMRFQNLDDFLDADMAAHPNRGEYFPSPAVAQPVCQTCSDQGEVYVVNHEGELPSHDRAPCPDCTKTVAQPVADERADLAQKLREHYGTPWRMGSEQGYSFGKHPLIGQAVAALCPPAEEGGKA